MIKVGQKVRFDPFDDMQCFGIGDVKGNYVIGTVVMVNRPHGWFSVEYGDPKLRTSFNFVDIGKAVELVGRG